MGMRKQHRCLHRRAAIMTGYATFLPITRSSPFAIALSVALNEPDSKATCLHNILMIPGDAERCELSLLGTL